MSDYLSDYRNQGDVDTYEEVQQHIEGAFEAEAESSNLLDENAIATPRDARSATAPPADEVGGDATPTAVAAPLVYSPHYQSGHINTYDSRRRSSMAGNSYANTPRSPSTQQRSPRVRRSGSVVSTRSDIGHITKENHNSLIVDPQIQSLRRQSLLSAARYRSARRASSVTNSTGLVEDAEGRGGSLRRGSRSSSIGSQRRRMSEAEAYAIEAIAVNDERRLEAYERAQEIAVERGCYIIDQEIEKHKRAEDNYVKHLDERGRQIVRTQEKRETRMDEALRRREELDTARRQIIQEKISRKNLISSEPYGNLLARKRYSMPMLRGTDGGFGGAIAPHRRNSTPIVSSGGAHDAMGNGSVDLTSPSDNRQQRSWRRDSSTSRLRTPSVVVEHPRGWR